MSKETIDSKADELAKKYVRVDDTGNSRATAYDAFEESEKERMSEGPQDKTTANISDIHVQIAGIQMDLTKLANTYGKLNVDFKTMVGKDKLYGPIEALKIKTYEILRRDEKADAMKLNAIKRRQDAIQYLVERMAEVLQDLHQKSIDGVGNAKGLRDEVMGHMKTLDERLIDNLKRGNYTTRDHTIAEKEVIRLEKELVEIDDTLLNYEKQVKIAKIDGDLDVIKTLTDEMTKVLNVKKGVLDGRLMKQDAVADIRRELLDTAEGAQSARGAIAASKVNYQATSSLIDSLTELEIKYRHAKEDMLPVFRHQGAIAYLGAEADDMRRALMEVADISNKLMASNAELVKYVAKETFDFLKTPVYDPKKAEKIEDDLRGFMDALNKQKLEWAESVQSVEANRISPHYTTHE